MKQNAFPLLTVLALTLAACASPASTQPPAVEPPATDAPAQPVATETLPASGGANEVVITLADNTLESSQTSFQAGVVYTFVITNNGSRKHNFNINPPTSVAGSLDAALAQALLIVTRDHLGPGQTYSVEFTFPASAIGQPLELSCLIQRHYDDGMRLNITVTQ